jgi:hypothetical protein
MKRRDLIALLSSATVALSFAAHAQKARPIIAILGSGAADAGSSKQLMSMLDTSMREVGLVQGQDYVFETRWADSDASRFSPLAAELLAGHPSAVVVSTILAAIDVQKLSRTVPIVGTGLNAPGRHRSGREPRPSRRKYHRRRQHGGGHPAQAFRNDA